MPSHRFNPLSALVGMAMVALGVTIAMFGFDEIDDDPVIWAAASAVFVALIILVLPTRLKPPADDAGSDR